MLENNLKKHIKQLHQKKFRKEFNEFLIEGIKGVTEAINSGVEIPAIIIEGNRREEPAIATLIGNAQAEDIDIFYAGRKDIGDIKTTDVFPGVQAIIIKQDIALEDLITNQPIICLNAVNDPGNLGTIIRTADWFGIPNILLGEGSVDAYNEKVVRSTMGSIFRTNIFKSKTLLHSLEKLKAQGYSIFALDLDGKDITTAQKDPKAIYIFGSESHGISKEIKALCNETYTIKKRGETESLNLAISVGITLHAIS